MSRFHIPSASASASISSEPTSSGSYVHPSPKNLQPSKAWVDPASLPNHGDVSTISGNAPDYVKQLNNNTFVSYGVGNEDCFAHNVGKAVKFVEVNVNKQMEKQGRLEATTIAEVVVSKSMVPPSYFMWRSGLKKGFF